MCGRLFQSLPLFRLLQIAKSTKCTSKQSYFPSYNVCPTSHIPVIKANKFYFQDKDEKQIEDEEMQKEDAKELQFMKWGHQSQFNMVINGRIQQMMNKRMFVNIIQNRCVVIMQGYFEWNQKKQPFSLRPKQGDHFLVAGLYTQNNQIIILTKDATPELAVVHHRMPVILSHEEVNIWMNPRNTKDIQNIINKTLLKKDKQIWKNVGFARIAPHVGSIKEKSIKCLMTMQQYKKELDKNGLMRFWKKPPKVEAAQMKKTQQISEIKQQKKNIELTKLQASKINKQIVTQKQEKHKNIAQQEQK